MERNEPAPCINEDLQVQRFDDFFHRFRRFMQLGELLRVERCGHFVLDAAAAHDGGHGSIGVPDASSANADSNGQQNTAPQGAGQQDGATSPELPSDDGAQGGQAGEASCLWQAKC